MAAKIAIAAAASATPTTRRFCLCCLPVALIDMRLPLYLLLARRAGASIAVSASREFCRSDLLASAIATHCHVNWQVLLLPPPPPPPPLAAAVIAVALLSLSISHALCLVRSLLQLATAALAMIPPLPGISSPLPP